MSTSPSPAAPPVLDPNAQLDGPRPSPLTEISEVLDLRWRTVAAVALGVALLGIVIAWAFPSLLSPEPFVGVIVGIAACLLAAAVGLAIDAADPTIRGPRHVRSSGARMLAVVDGPPSPRTTARITAWCNALLDRAGTIKIAFTPAAPHEPSSIEWADEVAADLARRGRRVLIVDLTPPGSITGQVGASEVCSGAVSLGQAADFHDELTLARLGPGRDPERAFTQLGALAERLPRDVEAMLVALPPLRQGNVVTAAGAVDRVLLLAAAETTSRVDLIAALDALDEVGAQASVVLLRDGAGGDHDDRDDLEVAPSVIDEPLLPVEAEEDVFGAYAPLEEITMEPPAAEAGEVPSETALEGYEDDFDDGRDDGAAPAYGADKPSDRVAVGDPPSATFGATGADNGADDGAPPDPAAPEVNPTDQIPVIRPLDDAPPPSPRAEHAIERPRSPFADLDDAPLLDEEEDDELPWVARDGGGDEPWMPPAATAGDEATDPAARDEAAGAGDRMRSTAALGTLADEIWSDDEDDD